MPTAWQIECFRDRFRSLELEISRVAEKDHPYPEPDTIYDALKEVLKSRLLHFNDVVENFELGDPESERKLQGELDTIADQLDYVAEVFSYADRVDSARIPFEILRSLSWVASTLLNEDCHTVVRLDAEYNYSILSCRREFENRGWEEEWLAALQKRRSKRKREVEENTAEQSTEQPVTVLLLGFPSYDAGSILLHALAAHELGHEIYYRHENQILEALDQAVQTVSAIGHRYHDELVDYAESNIKKPSGSGRTDDYDKSVNQVRAKLLEFMKDWLMEVFSDLVAAKLIGPAFIAAFDHIQLKLHKTDKTHPSGYLRRQIVHEYLKQALPHIIQDDVWRDLFHGVDVVNKPPTKDSGEPDDPLMPLYPVGEEICRLCLEPLSAILEDDKIPSPLKEEERIAALLKNTEEYIDHLAPPSVPFDVTGDPLSDVNNFWLLMYAAWHYRLNKSHFMEFAKRFGWAEDLGRAEDALGNLVLHGLESLELRFRWNQSRRIENGNGPHTTGAVEAQRS